jgi:hypothetical protein
MRKCDDVGKCENCGNDREEYLNHYCKTCLDKMTENNSVKTETSVS